MTTAARPTWHAAVGGGGKKDSGIGSLSKQFSVRDVAAHTKLKTRQVGQGTIYETANRDLKAELEQRERMASLKRKSGSGSGSGSSEQVEEIEAERVTQQPRLMIQPNDLDRDDEIRDEDSEEDNESEEEEEEDETAELLRELQKIKRERAEEQARREAEKAAEREKINMENALSSNPLMRSSAGDFSIKRRWDDDVVFKNCAKQEEKDQGFINDTLRSTFHRKFMSKYIV